MLNGLRRLNRSDEAFLIENRGDCRRDFNRLPVRPLARNRFWLSQPIIALASDSICLSMAVFLRVYSFKLDHRKTSIGRMGVVLGCISGSWPMRKIGDLGFSLATSRIC